MRNFLSFVYSSKTNIIFRGPQVRMQVKKVIKPSLKVSSSNRLNRNRQTAKSKVLKAARIKKSLQSSLLHHMPLCIHQQYTEKWIEMAFMQRSSGRTRTEEEKLRTREQTWWIMRPVLGRPQSKIKLILVRNYHSMSIKHVIVFSFCLGL